MYYTIDKGEICIARIVLISTSGYYSLYDSFALIEPKFVLLAKHGRWGKQNQT